MRLISDRVSDVYLQQPTPRPVPYGVVMELLNDYVFQRPSRFLLDPLVIVALVALLMMFLLRLPSVLLWLPILIIVVRLLIGVWRITRQVRGDLALLRRGLLIRAHILKLRPHRSITGEIDGALLDCAIPIADRRTHIGSVWFSDGNEAMRLMRQGKIVVLCLPQIPGTWRVVEPVHAELRYDRMGPFVTIPDDL